MTEENSRKSAAVLAALSVFALFTNLGGGSLASWDEALYASVARDMLVTGDWIRLHYGGSLWFDKPPLAMWVTAFFYKLFGVSEFASRLFASLCGVGTVFTTYALGRRLWGSWAGFCGAALLVSSTLFVTTARFGTLDSPLVFFLSAGLYFFWLGRDKPAWMWAFGASLGLAIMTKGFAAGVFVPVLVLYAAWSGEWRRCFGRAFWAAAALAGALAAPWHIYQITAFPEAFWNDVIVRHLFSRTTQAIEGHRGGWYFYFRVLLNKFRPAIFIGIAAIPWFLWQAARRRSKESLFVAAWIIGSFGLATLIRTKLNWYLYPALPPLSLAVGYALARWVKPKFFIVVALVAAGALCSHGFGSRRFFQDYSAPVKALAETVQREVPEDTHVYLVRYHEDPAVAFYWRRRVMDLDEPAQVEAALQRGPFYALIRQEDYLAMKNLMDREGVEVKKTLDRFYWVFAPGVV